MIKIVKITDGNGDSVYKLKKYLFGIIPIFGYLWADGELGMSGQSFRTYEEAEKTRNSFYYKEEVIQ